ncbi:hypothetical protein ACHHYP_05576 [Achlya hypogyna]|uniref:LCCL domain-containing protein n=1 Tax=Achlya hypogyna TaxID=1202772 RepID=A0A1V9YX27_ACHHY|nr:hypothetical protein ACHHYP_05576 [Achlya hypogyna]
MESANVDIESRPSLVQRLHRVPLDAPSTSTIDSEAIYHSIKPGARRWRQYLPLVIYLVLAVGLLLLLFYFSFYAATVNGQTPAMMGCRYFGYWKGPTCGLNGIDCQPFSTDWQAFRCPSGCLSDQSSALAVIGSGAYRGDSRICKAAIHAGAITSSGGCGLMRYDGARMSFAGTTANGVTSKSFNSWFPKVMQFYTDTVSIAHCTDLSWYILAVGFVATAGLAYFPTAPPLLLTHFQCLWGYLYVTLIASPSSFDYRALGLGLCTDAAVIVVAVHCWYHWVVRHTFQFYASYSLKERLVHWVLLTAIPFHIMLHLTQFAYLPWLNIGVGGYVKNSNLAAWTYVVFILLGLVALILAYWLLLEAYKQQALVRLAGGYAVVVVYAAVVYALFSDTIFHLHHVQIGLLLLPATAHAKRVAYFVQAIGLGLFIQGYAAWGWPTFLDVLPASYSVDVLDAAPSVANITNSAANITWPSLEGVFGYALMLNGVQVYRGVANWTTLPALMPNTTYFVTVSGIGTSGADGDLSPEGNFTTHAA